MPTSFLPQPAAAHGTLHTPPSRVFHCRFADNPENPQDPACAAAVAFSGSPQFLYDWSAIRQGDAGGQHQVVVPDGQLCSGGSMDFGGLDLPRADWRTTVLTPEDDGTFEFVYLASAPHSTQDMVFYMTPENWDPEQPLTWQDLDEDPTVSGIQPFCHLTSATLEPMAGVGDVYRMRCTLPTRTGRHTIFHVWQRDDSPEAFYACVDVVVAETGRIFGDGFEDGGLGSWSSASGGSRADTPDSQRRTLASLGPEDFRTDREHSCSNGVSKTGPSRVTPRPQTSKALAFGPQKR